MKHSRRLASGLIAAALSALSVAPIARAVPIVSEFMASNTVTLADQDGYYGDWVEIYNPDAVPDNLSGWYLTNKADTLNKWAIPSVTLQPGGYLVIFCTSKNYTDPTQPLATNFNLGSSGGYVALVEPDGKTVTSSYTYPIQYPDISYGVSQPTAVGEAPEIGYFKSATPGAANGNYTNVLLADRVTISVPPGIFIGSTTVTLSGTSAGEHIRYILVPPSATGDNDVPTPNASSPLYTGPVTIASSMLLRTAVFSANDTQQGITSTAMYVQLDAYTSNRLDTFSSNLSLVVYDDNGFGPMPNDRTFYPAWMGAYSLDTQGTATLTQTPDFFTLETMKDHGFSSATWPKQSYEAALTDSFGTGLNEALFGMDSEKNWDNISSWDIDRTYLHDAFVYALSNSMGHWAPATRFAEMFIHSAGGPLDYTSYSGITTMTDRLKVGPNRINIYALSPADVTPPNVTGGYIIRFDHPETSAGYYTWNTAQGTPIIIDTPKLDVLVQPQIAYITGYIQQMEDAMVADQASNYSTRNYLNFLDQPTWVDYHLINVFTENDDAFLYSEYFTKDVNGLLKAGPVWDYDRSMGSADGRDVNPRQWTPNTVTDFWNTSWWTYITHDPNFMQAWIDRWQSLRLTILSDNSLTGLVNSLAAQIGPAAAARDAARWSADVSRFPGAWSGEIANMNAWLTARTQWIDAQFVAAPIVNLSATNAAILPPTGAVVAYTLDGSDPRLSGGALSPTATLALGPLILAAGQTFQARSYNAGMAGVYPGSPWSSPVNSASAATAAGGELSNVSARAYVGTGSQALVVGFVVSGPTSKQVLIRGVGPALGQFNVSGFLSTPQLALHDSSDKVIVTDTGWANACVWGNSTTPATVQLATPAMFNQFYAFALPASSADCAMVATLPAAAYTAQISGVNGSTGVALAELYDADTGTPASHLVNISARAYVGTGSQVLVAGFIVSGSTSKIVLIRAVGPTLSQNYGLSGALANPELTLYDSTGAVVATNIGWGNPPVAGSSTVPAGVQPATSSIFSQVQAFPLIAGSADCAMIVSLPPGTYTAQVNGINSTTGIALAEVYAIP